MTDATGRVTLPPLALSRSAATLSAVQVDGQRTAPGGLEVAADRNVYRPQELAPAATSAVDVLDALPAVQVEADGGISLRGSASVAVQINGRPAPIRGPQLAAYLKSLPARVVDKVEVIPNPSAKNDPDGMAGIINLVLKQTTDLGLSGGLTTTVGGADRRTAAVNAGYQVGALTTFLSYGHTADAHAPRGDTQRAVGQPGAVAGRVGPDGPRRQPPLGPQPERHGRLQARRGRPSVHRPRGGVALNRSRVGEHVLHVARGRGGRATDGAHRPRATRAGAGRPSTRARP